MNAAESIGPERLGGKRYAMLIEHGKVAEISVEPPGEYGVSGGAAVLQRLDT